jgi:hypothetical protein
VEQTGSQPGRAAVRGGRRHLDREENYEEIFW